MGQIREFAAWMDRRSQLLLPVWIAVFVVVMWPAATRPLWYDELVTYYVSMSPTWALFWDSVRSVDLQPPLNFLLVRLSVMAFGDSAISVRLPSLLSYLVAGIVVHRLISKRLGGAHGLLAIGLLCCFPGVSFASEARPYALMLALLSCSLYCWTEAVDENRWSRWHTGLAISLGALFLSHCFGPVFGSAIGVGEVARSVAIGKVTRRVWIAILSPLAILPVYLPLLANVQSIRFPPLFQVTALTVPMFYMVLAGPMLAPLGFAAIYSSLRGSAASKKWAELLPVHEFAFAIAALAAPMLIIAYCAVSGVAFFHRYGIAAIVGAVLIAMAPLAKWIMDSKIALLGAMLLIGWFCLDSGHTGAMLARFQEVSSDYRAIEPNLPFVTANGLTFLEMDKREPAALAKRLRYLTNNEAALGYIHANMFEGLAKVQRIFPIRGQVLAYTRFIEENRTFLVFAMPGDHENWLLPKLKDDGAQIRLLSEEKATGYLDRRLYRVDFKTTAPTTEDAALPSKPLHKVEPPSPRPQSSLAP